MASHSPSDKPGRDAGIDTTIGDRVGSGPSDLVGGWQRLLGGLLDRMQPYLRPGETLTFQHLTDDEMTTFDAIRRQVQPPPAVCGLFLPPSVRNQMMYTNRGVEIPPEALKEPDLGAILFRRMDARQPLINALLARPPHVAAVDVYSDRKLLAGYTYADVDACLDQLQSIVDTHLRLPATEDHTRFQGGRG